MTATAREPRLAARKLESELQDAFLRLATAALAAPANWERLGVARRRRSIPLDALHALEQDTVTRVLQALVCLVAAQRGRLRDRDLESLSALDDVQASTGLRLPAPPSGHLSLPDDAWREALDALRQALPAEAPPSLAGDAYQVLLDVKLSETGGRLHVVSGRVGRKARGAWFTPESLVHRLVARTLAPVLHATSDVLALRIVDPAMGAGHFLLAAVDCLAEHMATHVDGCPRSHARHADILAQRRHQVAGTCLYGVDADPNATSLAHAALWLHAPGPRGGPPDLDKRLKTGNALVGASIAQLQGDVSLTAPFPSARESLAARADDWIAGWFPQAGGAAALARPFHWQLEFPEVAFDARGLPRPGFGFDAVVGNPPWDRIRPEKRAFYARHGHLLAGVDISDAQGPSLDRLIARLERACPALRREWASYDASIRSLTRYLRGSGSYLAQQAEIHGRAAGGDPDLFRFFVERAFQCVRPGGRVGLVVPAALWQADGSTGLRRMLLRAATIDELCVFENRRKWAFDIDSRYKFSTFTATATPAPEGHRIRAAFMLPGPEAWDEPDSPRFVSVSADLAERLSPETLALPDVRTARDAALLDRLHRVHFGLGDPRSGWKFTYCRELDITTDAHWFRTAAWMRERGFSSVTPGLDSHGRWTCTCAGPPDCPPPRNRRSLGQHGGERWLAAPASWYRRHGYLPRKRPAESGVAIEFIHPQDLERCRDNARGMREESFLIRPAVAYTALYEGRMVHHFDHAQKGWLSGEGPRAVWTTIPFDRKALRPRVFVAPAQVRVPLPNRIAFGAVASATNERSLLAALLPDDCLAGNSTPTLASPSRAQAALLLCVLCSFVFDYLVRLRTTSNINWTQLSRVAVPRSTDIPPSSRTAMVEAAIRLSCTTPELAPAWNELFPAHPWTPQSAERDPWKRAELRALVDSLVADAYGLAPEEYALILASFPLLDRGQPALPGDMFVDESPSAPPRPRSFVTRDLALLVHLQRSRRSIPPDLHAFFKHDLGIDPDDPSSRFRIGPLRGLEDRVRAARALGAVPYVPPGS